MFVINPIQVNTIGKTIFNCAILTLFLNATGSFQASKAQANESEDQNIVTHSTSSAFMKVTLNQVTMVKLEEQISDALIGNPAIADITIQNNSTFIITGKSYGRTNIILLNKDGDKIFNKWVHVDDDARNVVRIQRGAARLSYTCTPNCQPTPTLGDDPAYLKSLTGNLKTKLKSIESVINPEK